MRSGVKKVVLAYSGGLDTSVILRWLQDYYRCEVITFTADLGQGEELEPARAKAELMGAKRIFVEDHRPTKRQFQPFPGVLGAKGNLGRQLGLPAWDHNALVRDGGKLG